MTSLAPQQAGDTGPIPPAITPNEDQSGEINPLQRHAAAPKLQTNLQLTPTQLDNLTQRALDRIDELRGEMGLLDRGQVDDGSWMGKRQQNQAQYDNDWQYRAALGIFKFSNFSVNISKRYSRLISAKAKDDLVGTDPFFAAMPETHGDPETAKEVEWFLQEKIRQSNAKKAFGIGIKTALIRNECVMKPTYISNVSKFRGPARVAVGPNMYEAADGIHYIAQGEPIMTPRGNYIYELDDFFPDPNVEGIVRLKKEPMVQFRNAPVFADFDDLDQTMIHQEGLDLRGLDYRDFLCPLNVATVHEADINVHLFDEQWEKLVYTYGIFEVSQGYVTQPYMSGEKSAKSAQGEQEGITSKILKIVNCADVYMRCDADDDGVEEEIWMIIDLVAKKAIWYDYLGAHLKKRPFEVIPGIEQVANRWYGVGVFEMLDHKQTYIDTQFNRVNFKSSKNSSVRFRVKNAVDQWKADQEVVFGDDQIFDISDQRYNAQNPPLFQVQLTEIDEHAMRLIELMLQASSSEIGIAGPNDAAMAGLDTTKLAEGIKAMERTGNVLMKETEGSHNEAINALLVQCMDIVLEHMDQDELIFHPDSGSLIQLNRDEIRAMTKNVRLLLTRSRSTETIETARMVVQLCREYYEALNPEEQNLLRDEYLRQLRALEVQDANELLREVSEEEVAAWKKEQQQAAKLPPKTSIATKYTDLERPEQVQVLTREGIQPAQVGPVTSHQAQEVAQTGMEANAKEQAKVTAAPALEKAKAQYGPKPAAKPATKS